jgi:hypothetical protein
MGWDGWLRQRRPTLCGSEGVTNRFLLPARARAGAGRAVPVCSRAAPTTRGRVPGHLSERRAGAWARSRARVAGRRGVLRRRARGRARARSARPQHIQSPSFPPCPAAPTALVAPCSTRRRSDKRAGCTGLRPKPWREVFFLVFFFSSGAHRRKKRVCAADRSDADQTHTTKTRARRARPRAHHSFSSPADVMLQKQSFIACTKSKGGREGALSPATVFFPLPPQRSGAGRCVGSRPNRFLHSTRSRLNLSSGEKRAGWAEWVGVSPTYFCVKRECGDGEKREVRWMVAERAGWGQRRLSQWLRLSLRGWAWKGFTTSHTSPRSCATKHPLPTPAAAGPVEGGCVRRGTAFREPPSARLPGGGCLRKKHDRRAARLTHALHTLAP